MLDSLAALIPPQVKAAWVGIKTALAIGAVLGFILLGWVLRGWYSDHLQLARQAGADAAVQAAINHSSVVAATVERQLARLKANQTVIEREKIKLVDRPVYRNVCIDADGLRLLSALAGGYIPAKPAGKVPPTDATH